MKKTLCLLMLLSLAPAGFAVLAPEVESSLKPTHPLVVTAANLEDLWTLRPATNSVEAEYVMLDVPFERLSSEMIQVLRDFVARGHGIVMTTHNGSQALFPEAIMLRVTAPRDEDYVYSAVTEPTAHAVLSGVRRVQIDKCDRDRDGIKPWVNSQLVMDAGDKGEPLLGGFNLRDGGAACFGAIAYAHGSGRIAVFAQRADRLPLIQNPRMLKLYDNHRFAANLDQWLAGYAIPGSSLDVAPVKDDGPTGTSGATDPGMDPRHPAPRHG